ncbi:IPT/TIG domain-containing protein [Nitrospira moscoviensis]|nr:IPT/TIG domain-containing protein [Nitrospira moscoviensis]
MSQVFGQSMGYRGRAVLFSAALALAGVLSGSAADISYVYDHLGRLIAVIDPATDTAVYSYDAVGNLTGITRQSSGTLAVFQFTPSGGPVGTTVTIYGTGFSATPASNTVKFNGTTATVLTASTTVLTATVPNGATTGPISVTVAGTTATSVSSFTTGSGAAPTITSFSPTVGAFGTTVTLTGTNYDATPTKNKVTFNPAYGTVTTASATSLGVTVPVGAQSGPIGVATVNGNATSSQDFFVSPAGIPPADVQFTGRIVVGGATVVASITTANKVGLVVFDGIAGQRLNLGLTNVTIPSSTVSFIKPDGTVLSFASIGSGGGSLDSPVLPVTGTYTILIDPASTYTGNMTLTLSAELVGNLTIAGTPATVSITRVGQNARYFFTGTAGQTVSLGMTGVTITQSNVSMYKPDGSVFIPATSINTSGGALDTQVLPVSGAYAILVDPVSTYTGNMTLTLYGAADVTGTIALDGASVTSSLTVPGQRARYTFTGTAGQWVNVGLTSVSITSSTVSVLRPDGTTLSSVSVGTGGGSLDPPVLPSTGTYTIVVDPAGLYTGSMTLTLSSALTGSITLDGASVPISFARAGQTARYTFSGTAGQWVSLGLTSVTLTTVNVTLLKPDDTTLTSASVGTSGGGLEPPSTLPTTGTYTIVVDPAGTYTGNITLTLMSYLTGTLNLDGAATVSTISTIGQNALYTFSGTAGQWVGLGITSVTITSSTVMLLKPDGTTLSSANVTTAGATFDPPALPTTGTYTITVNPAAHYTGNMTLTLSSDVTGSVTINDPATTISIGRPGQNARYTFAGTAGQQVTVRITGNTLGALTVNLYTPSGGWQTGAGNSATSFNLPTVTLGTTGTYTVTISPGTTTGTLNLQVTNP